MQTYNKNGKTIKKYQYKVFRGNKFLFTETNLKNIAKRFKSVGYTSKFSAESANFKILKRA